MTGWRPPVTRNSPVVEKRGRVYFRVTATSASETVTSTSATAPAVALMAAAAVAVVCRRPSKISRSSFRICSSASRIFTSSSFNSGVVKRSALTRVCLRS